MIIIVHVVLTVCMCLISREEFNTMCADLMLRMRNTLEMAIADSGKSDSPRFPSLVPNCSPCEIVHSCIPCT